MAKAVYPKRLPSRFTNNSPAIRHIQSKVLEEGVYAWNCIRLARIKAMLSLQTFVDHDDAGSSSSLHLGEQAQDSSSTASAGLPRAESSSSNHVPAFSTVSAGSNNEQQERQRAAKVFNVIYVVGVGSPHGMRAKSTRASSRQSCFAIRTWIRKPEVVTYVLYYYSIFHRHVFFFYVWTYYALLPKV
jgi:hypothetical protein